MEDFINFDLSVPARPVDEFRFLLLWLDGVKILAIGMSGGTPLSLVVMTVMAEGNQLPVTSISIVGEA